MIGRANIRHVKEGDIEEVWFLDISPGPVHIVITSYGFDLRDNFTRDVILRVFVPKWWPSERRSELAQTYASIVELRAGVSNGAD